MNFQNIFSQLWKVKIFCGIIDPLWPNTYFRGTVMYVQYRFLTLILTRPNLPVYLELQMSISLCVATCCHPVNTATQVWWISWSYPLIDTSPLQGKREIIPLCSRYFILLLWNFLDECQYSTTTLYFAGWNGVNDNHNNFPVILFICCIF